jgi:subtilase family serine protease
LLGAVAAVLVAGCGGTQLQTAAPKFGNTSAHVRLTSERVAAGPNVAGWGPADFQARYKLPSSEKGAGEIVAIVEAYDNPNVASDLGQYRTQFGLGTADFTKYNQRGQQKNYPTGDTGWGVEIDLAVEMVSATCPLCTIYLIEADSNQTSDLQAAETEAVMLGAHIVSNGWACNGSGCLDKRAFSHHGVTYIAAGGDSGFSEVTEPAAFDTVAAIGGTQLSKQGSQYSESIWSSSIGGCAAGIKKPKWQHDLYCDARIANDAAAVAVDIAIYDSYGAGGWGTVGGTSAAAPLVAGIFGLAGNATRQDGGRTFWMRRHHRHLYAPGGACYLGYSYGQYNECTGWGTPDGIGAF